MTGGYKGLQSVIRVYRELKGVTGSYCGLESVTGN